MVLAAILFVTRHPRKLNSRGGQLKDIYLLLILRFSGGKIFKDMMYNAFRTLQQFYGLGPYKHSNATVCQYKAIWYHEQLDLLNCLVVVLYRGVLLGHISLLLRQGWRCLLCCSKQLRDENDWLYFYLLCAGLSNSLSSIDLQGAADWAVRGFFKFLQLVPT